METLNKGSFTVAPDKKAGIERDETHSRMVFVRQGRGSIEFPAHPQDAPIIIYPEHPANIPVGTSAIVRNISPTDVLIFQVNIQS